jgi:hypothetical protein
MKISEKNVHKMKTRNAELATGGTDHMFGKQQAGTRVPGRSGKPDQRGPGKRFPEGGAGTGKQSKIGTAAPAGQGRTGNVRGSRR